ncbi:PD40 domain-containing protein [bacterium]|nr:PD40 domain-containing protein [bacterium]
MRNHFLTAALACICTAALHSTARANEYTVDAGLLRYPDVSADSICFSFGNDVWTVPLTGGTATRLSSTSGEEILARFSPDGSQIAYSANYEGSRDVYILPREGGIPRRLTWNPGSCNMVDFTADGDVLFYSGHESKHNGGGRIYRVSSRGGIPTALPMEFAVYGSLDRDGRTFAFTPSSRETRTWKRYQGGLAQDIWLLDIESLESEQITDWPGTDALPMIDGNDVWYMSDRGPAHRLNLWRYDRTTKEHGQMTEFTDFDIKWPSMGPAHIVFENGGDLWLYDKAGGKAAKVAISLPGDRPSLMTTAMDVTNQFGDVMASPNGKRLVGEARGDVWTVPVEEGINRNLTMTDGFAERNPRWSPDGQWICWLADNTGNYELYISQSDGKGETRQLTKGSQTFYTRPEWSPDSKKISYADSTGRIYIFDIDRDEAREIDRDPWAYYPYTGVNWSADSRWVTYGRLNRENQNSQVMLYDFDNDELHAVTDPMFGNIQPVFDLSGDYLYYISRRNFNHRFGDLDSTYVFTDNQLLTVVPLRNDVDSPFALKNDEEEIKAEEKQDENEKQEEEKEDGATEDESGKDEKADRKDGKKEKKKGIEIDIEGFESRAVDIPLRPGGYGNLQAADHRIFYSFGGFNSGREVYTYDLKEQKEEKLGDGIGGFQLLPGGKQMLISGRGNRYAIVKAGPGARFDKAIEISGLVSEVNPRHEWKQLVTDAWRFYRDLFYAPNLHEVDWELMGQRYIGMVDHAVNRQDVSYIIGEMIGELNTGHTYYSGPGEDEPRRSTGLLGADYELATQDGSSAWRISHIFHGADFDVDSRGPLDEPGLDVSEGDFLLAVNGRTLSTELPVWAGFQGLAGQTTILTVSGDAVLGNDDDREVIVRPVGSEQGMRRFDWIEANRQRVLEATDGKVGYIYVPNTSGDGVNNLMRQLQGQYHLDGLVIDERWNGGGYIPTYFIDILGRKTYSYWARRDGEDWSTPDLAHNGPKVMLINAKSGSGGDAFPYYFRQAGLGPLVGTRTWGGLVGISGSPRLIDGSRPSIPIFGFYELDGTWGIEGHGVDPDVEVIDDPGLLARGEDPQLDAAIAEIRRLIFEQPYRKPGTPPWPDRSGVGVRESEK